jgi:ATP-dependent Clp protease adapter protein ClpS
VVLPDEVVSYGRTAMRTSSVGLAEQPELTYTPMCRVLLHSDKASSMIRVVRSLQAVFGYSWHDACLVMLVAKRHGIGLCGTWPREYAEVCQDGLAAYGLLASVESDYS